MKNENRISLVLGAMATLFVALAAGFGLDLWGHLPPARTALGEQAPHRGRRERQTVAAHPERVVDGVGDRRHARMHHQHGGGRGGNRDWHKVAQQVVAEVLVERHADGLARHDEQQRVPVGRSARHCFGAEIAADAGAVFHHHHLLERGAKPLGDRPAEADQMPIGMRTISGTLPWPPNMKRFLAAWLTICSMAKAEKSEN